MAFASDCADLLVDQTSCAPRKHQESPDSEADLDESAFLPPTDLCVGGRPAPFGIRPTPVFSWHPSIGDEQTRYELQVGHRGSTRSLMA